MDTIKGCTFQSCGMLAKRYQINSDMANITSTLCLKHKEFLQRKHPEWRFTETKEPSSYT